MLTLRIVKNLIALACWTVAVFIVQPLAASADERPRLWAGAPVAIGDAITDGFINLRSRPEPRSELVARLLAQTTGIRASGRVEIYGDTWWVEVEAGVVTGWANARLLVDGDRVPLQAFVNIDDLPEIPNRMLTGGGYRRADTTSFEECARLCVKDGRCRAIDYSKPSLSCRLHDTLGGLVEREGYTASAKTSKLVSSSGPFIDSRQDRAFDTAGYSELIAATSVDCARACDDDRRCQALQFHAKRNQCILHQRFGKTVTRPGAEVAARPAADAPRIMSNMSPRPGEQPPQLPRLAAAEPGQASPTPSYSAAPVANYTEVAQIFHGLIDQAVQGEASATGDIDRQGRIRFSRVTSASAPSADGTRVAGAATLEGRAHNLVASIDQSRPRRVDLFFVTDAGFREKIGSSDHDSPQSAAAFQRRIQGEIEQLARVVSAVPRR